VFFFYLDREDARGEWRAAPRVLNSRRLQSLFRPLIGQICPCFVSIGPFHDIFGLENN